MGSCCRLALIPALLSQIESGNMPEPQWSCHTVHAVAVDKLAPRSKVDLDGERMVDGAAWAAEVMPSFINVIVGSSPLRAFDGLSATEPSAHSTEAMAPAQATMS